MAYQASALVSSLLWLHSDGAMLIVCFLCVSCVQGRLGGRKWTGIGRGCVSGNREVQLLCMPEVSALFCVLCVCSSVSDAVCA